MDVVQGRATLTEIAIARTCWFAFRPTFFPTEGRHLMPAMIKISAAEISTSWRCPGGKQHVRPHVGFVCPRFGATTPRIVELDFYIVRAF